MDSPLALDWRRTHLARMRAQHLSEMTVRRPEPETLARVHAQRLAAVDTAGPDELVALVSAWDRDRRTYESHKNLAHIRFAQDTRDAARKDDREFFDDLGPTTQGEEVAFLRAILASTHRGALERAFGTHALDLWTVAAGAFEPVLAESKRAESRLVVRYDEVRAGIRFDVRGERHTLATVRGLYGKAERALRLEAAVAESAALGAREEELDAIYDELVVLRDGMGRLMGQASYTPLGYQWMRRTDWGPADAAAFRQSVLDHIVPIAARIRNRRAETLGLRDLAFHDEGVRDDRGVPRPDGDPAWILARAEEVCDRIHPELGDFVRMMQRRGLLDLLTRDGKVGGGFAEVLADAEAPFILTNWNGSQDDVVVLMHELGHGFQMRRSLSHTISDFVLPTYEAAEVHSMGLELLAFPHMERFFGADADRFRAGHLEHALLFLPYACLVDEFQHEVFAAPSLGSAGRAALWQELERRYLPWRRYVDAPYWASGRVWQRQLHLYHQPFYYLDYALAQCCALQLWELGRRTPERARDQWYDLCGIGGSQGFASALRSVGLDNPMRPGSLHQVAAAAAEVLGVA